MRLEYDRFFGDYEEAALLTVDTEAVDIYRDADLEEILRYAGKVAVR